MFLFKLALFSFPFLSFHFISTCLNTNIFSLFLISLFCHSCTPLNHCCTAEWLILGGHGFTVNFVQNINKTITFRKNPSVKSGSKNKTVQGKEAVGPSARGPRCETWSKTKVIFLRWNTQKILKVIDNFFKFFTEKFLVMKVFRVWPGSDYSGYTGPQLGPHPGSKKENFFFLKAPGLYFLKYSVLKPIGEQNWAVCY